LKIEVIYLNKVVRFKKFLKYVLLGLNIHTYV
jgi:hypothetical protein